MTGARIITGLVPATCIPDEILTDHPDRFRAMLVESGNPVHSLADSQRMREALDALDVVVVIDVALTETGPPAPTTCCPASSQFEKWEATFFNLEFPRNAFHLRRAAARPAAGHAARARDPRPAGARRSARSTARTTSRRCGRAAEAGRDAFADAFFAADRRTPELGRAGPVVLYRTLGPTLPRRRARPRPALWGAGPPMRA